MLQRHTGLKIIGIEKLLGPGVLSLSAARRFWGVKKTVTGKNKKDCCAVTQSRRGWRPYVGASGRGAVGLRVDAGGLFSAVSQPTSSAKVHDWLGGNSITGAIFIAVILDDQQIGDKFGRSRNNNCLSHSCD